MIREYYVHARFRVRYSKEKFRTGALILPETNVNGTFTLCSPLFEFSILSLLGYYNYSACIRHIQD